MADLPPLTIVRRFALWLVICAVSAAPSFALARSVNASIAGMVVAVLTFAVIYGTLSCTRWFEHVRRRPFVRSTMYVGYGLRLGLSLLILLGMTSNATPLGYAIFVDLICGSLSLRIVGLALGTPRGFDQVANTFAGAFATTCVQGAILNVVVFLVMAIAYGLQRAFRTPPAESGPRGFEVVPIE